MALSGFPVPQELALAGEEKGGGSIFVGAMSQKMRKCPIECRPKEHPEWTLC